jgi:hypothetical protein
LGIFFYRDLVEATEEVHFAKNCKLGYYA